MAKKGRSRRNARIRRHARVRRKVSGTAERPRLSVFRSSRHIYAQLIDDREGVTLAAASTMSSELRESLDSTGTVEAATVVGAAIGEAARAKGIEKATFDRGGFRYHGRVKALADAARAAGLDLGRGGERAAEGSQEAADD